MDQSTSINQYRRKKSSRIFNKTGLSKFKNTSDSPVVLDGADVNELNDNSITNAQVDNVSSVSTDLAILESPGKTRFTKSLVRQGFIDPSENVAKKKRVDDQGVPVVEKKNVSFKQQEGLRSDRKGKRKADESDKSVKAEVNLSNKSFKDVDVQGVKRSRRGKESVKSEEEEKPKFALSHSNSLLRSRTTPRPMFTLISDLKPVHKTCVNEMGFGSLLGFSIDSLPGKIAYYVANNFDPSRMVIKTKGGLIEVTKESVNEVFGIPLGGVGISSLPDVTDQTFVKKWKHQFETDAVRPSDIIMKIKHATEIDFTFKMNFLMVFANTLGICESNGICSYTVLKKVTEDVDIKDYDWCEFIIDCLKSVKKPKSNTFYVGPITFLTLLYLDRTKFDFLPVVRLRPSYRSWKTSLLKERESLEFEHGGFGNVELRGNFDEEEHDEGFLNIEDEVIEKKQTDILSKINALSTANKEGYLQKIKSMFSLICDVKLVLETTLDEAFWKYPDDLNILDFFKQFNDLFKKKGVSNEDSADRFTGNVGGDAGDGGGGEGPSSVGGSGNVGGRGVGDEGRGGEGPSSVGGNGGSGNISRRGVGGEGPNLMGGNVESGNVGGECSKKTGGFGDSTNQDGERSSKGEDVNRSGKEDSRSSNRELHVNLNFHGSGNPDESNTQWAVRNIDHVLESLQLTILGCSPHTQPLQTEFPSFDSLTAPNFSLGLSEGGMCPVNMFNDIILNPFEFTDYVEVILDCGVTTENVVDQGSQKTAEPKPKAEKRQRKPSIYVCSPYVNKKTVVETKTSPPEHSVADSVFAMRGDKMEPVFQVMAGLMTPRVKMESLAPGLAIEPEVIDAWVEVINYEEKNKEPDALSRLFFSTQVVSQEMHYKDFDVKKEFESFMSTVSSELDNDPVKMSMKYFDLVFFPVQTGLQFYVFVFNLKKVAIHIIDNNCFDVDYNEKYMTVCDSVKLFFSKYLDCLNHPKAATVAKSKPSIMKLKWGTKKNDVDSGVFSMLHMENYMGQAVASWKCGLSPESNTQNFEIQNLRAKFATKLVCHELNIHKKKMVDLALEFDKMFTKKERKVIVANAIKDRQIRLNE